MKMRYIPIIAAAILMSLPGCKKQTDPNYKVGQIVLSTQMSPGEIIAGVSSKAPIDNTAQRELYFARNDQNLGGTYTGYNPTPLLATRTAGPGFQTTTFAKIQYFLPSGKQTKMVGWVPVATTSSALKASWTINGTIDVMTSIEHNGNKGTIAVPGKMPDFTFEHQLSQIQFWPYVDSLAIQQVWGNLEKIEVTLQKKSCSYTFASDESTGKIVFDDATASSTFAVNALTAGAIPIGKAKAVLAGEPMMIEPQASASYVLNIQTTTKLGGVTKATITQAFEKGKAYKLQLRMKATQIDVSASITNWIVDEAETDVPNHIPQHVDIDGAVWCGSNLMGIGDDVHQEASITGSGTFFKWGQNWNYTTASGTADGFETGAMAGASTMPAASSTGGLGYDFVGLSGGRSPGDPCQRLGTEFRTPTQQDWIDLYASRGGEPAIALQSLGGVKGLFFGPGAQNITTNQEGIPKGMIFLPAVGYRESLTGVLTGLTTACGYWTSSISKSGGNLAYGFNAVAGSVMAGGKDYNRGTAMSVRCLIPAPTATTSPREPDEKQIKLIGGTYWTTGNLVASGTANCRVGLWSDGGLYFQFGSLVGWSGGADGSGKGTASAICPLAQKVKPSGYAGSVGWAASGYFKADNGAANYGPGTDFNKQTGGANVAATGIGDPCAAYLGGKWRLPTAADYARLCKNVANGATWANAGGKWRANAPVGGYLNLDTLFFPASGMRAAANGALTAVGVQSLNWSSSVHSAANGYNISMVLSDVTPQASTLRAGGLPVRCVIPPPPPPATETIAGTKWLCGNLTASAQGATTGFTVEPTPQGLGYFWKWGSKHAYDRVSGALPNGHWDGRTTGAATIPTDRSKDYDYAKADGVSVGGPAGDPCQVLGASYKTPTQTQWQALVSSGTSSWTTYQSQSGYFFGSKASTCTNTTIQPGCIFLPAAGYRGWSNGSLAVVGSNGYYWSSSVDDANYGWYLYFYSSGGINPASFNVRSNGLSVRCVQE